MWKYKKEYKGMNGMKQSYWVHSVQDHFFLSKLFPSFTSLAGLDSPRWQWPQGDIKSDIFLVEVAGLHCYDVSDSAAWLETSHVALIAWEWTGVITGLLKGWEKKNINL